MLQSGFNANVIRLKYTIKQVEEEKEEGVLSEKVLLSNKSKTALCGFGKTLLVLKLVYCV